MSSSDDGRRTWYNPVTRLHEPPLDQRPVQGMDYIHARYAEWRDECRQTNEETERLNRLEKDGQQQTNQQERQHNETPTSPTGGSGALQQQGQKSAEQQHGTKKKKEEEEEEVDVSVTRDDANALKEEGNQHYRAGDYEQALAKYDEALRSVVTTDEERATYWCNRAAVHMKLTKYASVVDDTTEALKLVPGYRKALVRRKEAHEHLEVYGEAIKDARLLEMGDREISRLQKLKEKHEKETSEAAMATLKDLGNMVLSNFGMSVDDFSVERSDETGGYQIRQKNK